MKMFDCIIIVALTLIISALNFDISFLVIFVVVLVLYDYSKKDIKEFIDKRKGGEPE